MNTKIFKRLRRLIRNLAGKISRWLQGGLWVKHKDEPWRRVKWSTRKSMIWDEKDRSFYHKTFITIEAIEDYTEDD